MLRIDGFMLPVSMLFSMIFASLGIGLLAMIMQASRMMSDDLVLQRDYYAAKKMLTRLSSMDIYDDVTCLMI